MPARKRRPRVIPVLLVHGSGLRKGVRFSDGAYVGDPINAMRIFNDKEVDEVIVLDVLASVEQRPPDLGRIREWASECFMPMCYGGGVASMREMELLFQAGIEKISLSTASTDSNLIQNAARSFGNQSVVVTVDVQRNWLGKPAVKRKRGRELISNDVVEWARRLQDLGVGEIVLQSINRDGAMGGYDLDLIRMVAGAIEIPVVALGGGGSIRHFQEALDAGASAVAAGSMFVFHGPHKAVLITYPSRKELDNMAREK